MSESNIADLDKNNIKLQNNLITLYSYNPNGAAVLYYSYRLVEKVHNVDYITDLNLPVYSYHRSGLRNMKDKIKLCSLGEGIHTVKFENKGVKIEVIAHEFMSSEKPFRIYEILISQEYPDVDSHKFLINFIETSKEKYESFFDSFSNKETIKRLICTPDGFWQKLNVVNKRDTNTLFLPENVKENLNKFVKEFFSEKTQEDFIKYGKPYKCNVLLHGLPGTGKTSLINTIASEINSNIGIISFNKMDDVTLSDTLRSFLDEDDNHRKVGINNKHRILVMEDIDRLFHKDSTNDDNGKTNLVSFSGLLNCLDGMCRMEGIIIFLTANKITDIDAALKRPGRIDYTVKFDYANEHQMKEMCRFFFPEKEEMCNKFHHKIKHKEFTTASLHQFLFNHRNVDDINEHFSEFIDLIKLTENEVDTKNMYA